MARPRVFISSTFYDLRHVRQDLERFVRELGYEPVRNETGAIPYRNAEKLETAAYREVDLCDIIVAIVGGRYGTASSDDPGYSISQAELRRALEKGIQVYIFVERSVLAEHSTYRLNKRARKTKYSFVDNIKIYEFIDELMALPQNNAIAPFETSDHIIDYLRAQWAGLFQKFLQEQRRLGEVKVFEDISATAKTLRELVTFLTEERANQDQAIRTILLANHPVFRQFADLTDTSYRVYFQNRAELNRWLRAKGWKSVTRDKWDPDSIAEWSKPGMGYIKLTHRIFDEDGNLKVFTEDQWESDWLQKLDDDPAAQSESDE